MKILIIDDHPLVRKGIASALSYEKIITSIEEASSVDEAVKKMIMLKPDIAILDLYLASEDGLEVVKKSRERRLETKFLVLTSSSRKSDFERASRCEVEGYLLKEAFAEDIVYAINVIARGKIFYETGLYRSLCSQSDEFDELTPREMEVLEQLGKGLSNSQIALNLYISENTVKKHVSSILEKLSLKHRTEAALIINRKSSTYMA